MLTTSPTLLEAARSGSATPHVRVRFSDRDVGVPRLHFARWYQGVEAAGPAGVAFPGDGSLVRARIDAGAATLHVQHIATPSEAADFTSWADLGSAVATPGLGLHAAGTRVLLAYTDGTQVLVRESLDAGATFGSAITVASPGAVTALSGAVRSDGSAIATWAIGGTCYVATRPAGGGWSAPAAWTQSLASINGVAAGDAEDWAILVSGEDSNGRAGCWSTRLGSGIGGPPGHWSALAPLILASPGLDVSYRATGVAQAGAPRATFVESYTGTGAFDRTMLATGLAGGAFEDGDWRDPTPFEHASPWGLAAAARGTTSFLASASELWSAEIGGSPVDVSTAVLSARYEADHRGERLRLALDAQSLTNWPSVGTEIEFSPGYVTDAGIEFITGRLLWVTSVQRGAAELHVTAEGALGRLARWQAPRQLAWSAGDATIATVARSIARDAGVRLAGAGASTAATTLTPGFAVRAGESGATALARLLARVPDQIFGRGIDLHLVERDPAEDPSYAYGATHPIRTIELTDSGRGPRWARVLGADAVGEAVASGGGDDGSRVAVVVDAAVTSAPVATARAEAVLRRSELAQELGTLEASPHPGHEPGDVIAVSDDSLALDAAPYRVRSVTFDYARRPRGRYSMRLGLGAV
ncbi:MAG: hypothetical protein H6675_01460 [Dehalococcoidia bacterium]|nr:hypothetical protein [Dehalococcoidia bacterium]